MNIWVHAVWGTKHRREYLTRDIKESVLQHIRRNAQEKGIRIDRLNAFSDHVHCLFRLSSDMTLAMAMQLLKGESARWINQEKMTQPRFQWAREYFASSVSESALKSLRAYITTKRLITASLNPDLKVGVEIVR